VKIGLDEVRQIAGLAHLELSDPECRDLASHLGELLDYIEMLKELDTSSVSPTSHLQESGEAFREDDIKASLSEAEALANAPEHGSGLFKVPKVIG